MNVFVFLRGHSTLCPVPVLLPGDCSFAVPSMGSKVRQGHSPQVPAQGLVQRRTSGCDCGTRTEGRKGRQGKEERREEFQTPYSYKYNQGTLATLCESHHPGKTYDYTLALSVVLFGRKHAGCVLDQPHPSALAIPVPDSPGAVWAEGGGPWFESVTQG